MKNLNIKTVCIVLIIAIALSITGCVDVEPNVTEPLCATQPADPGSDGPSKPVDPSTPSNPAPSEPDVPTEPSEPADPVIPSEPDDPIVPSEPVHEHEYVAVVTKATCIEVGFTTYTCDCGDTYVGDRIEATGHQWSDWVVTKEPTVDENGEAVSVCAMCENTQSKVLDKIIPNHSHSYTEEVTKAATCTAEGVMTLTCSCGNSHTERIEKIPHSYKATVTKPTCTNKGYTTYKCSCGDSYKDSYVNATGHKFSSYTSNGDATCSKDGTKTASCSVCGSKETKTDAGSAKGHSYKVSVIAATCAERGYTLHKCSACGDSYKDSYTDTTDHRFYLARQVEASMFVEGYTIYACYDCDYHYETDREPKIPQEEYEKAVAEAVVKYINQFRQEQGDTVATVLPVLTLIAEERAVQLQDNFKHDVTASRNLYEKYQYGEWVDGSSWGGSQYYSPNAKEAIAARGIAGGSPDSLGKLFAMQFLNSPGHWSYVGSSDYSYIGVGISYNGDAASGYDWHCCVLQTSKNYG